MSYSKTETVAFNIDEEIKSQESLITIGDNKIKNVLTFKYLGHTITNDEKKTSRFLYGRIERLTKNGMSLNMSSLIDESSCRLELDTRQSMETNGKTSRCGQGSSEKSYDDKNRSDATGGCKSNPTRSAPKPDMRSGKYDDDDDDYDRTKYFTRSILL